ncbi:UNVERIFIED_ORG: hypothetical protein J2W85_000490 [Ensifer adhaerens]|jgi:hypothetical protein|nr:hypothetical protein [Ensifer adhaerens]
MIVLGIGAALTAILTMMAVSIVLNLEHNRSTNRSSVF